MKTLRVGGKVDKALSPLPRFQRTKVSPHPDGVQMKICAYCGANMGRVKGLKGRVSHGLCNKCVKPLEDAARLGEHAVKKCPECPRNIGSWLKSCVPCAKEKALV